MNIAEAKNQIADTVEGYLTRDETGAYLIAPEAQRPLFLLGAPGIGKTAVVGQVARELGIGLVSYSMTHHTRQSALGLPFIVHKRYGGEEFDVSEYTMSEIIASIYDYREKTGHDRGILFLDEINCVSETLYPSMLQFLQCKMFGNHAIPQGWVIVAAGNPPEYNKSVREFDVVTMDRVKKIEVEPDFAVWKEYAVQNQLHPAVIAYLTTRTTNFYRMETTVDGRKFATPRGWEDLSQMLYVYEQLQKNMDRDVVVQYIQHEKIAKDFANYLELYYKYQMDYQLDAVLQGKIDPLLLKKAGNASFDERLSVLSLLLARCRRAFATIFQKRAELELLFGELKKLRMQLLEEEAVTEPQRMVQAAVEAFAGEYEAKHRAELLTRREDHIYRAVQKTLEHYASRLFALDEREAATAEGAFACIRSWFNEAQDALDAQETEALAMLEHAFDFVEEAYGGGQEMVIFITELNSDYYSVKFLGEHECERYYRYNKQLLLDDASQSIEEQLRQMGR